MFPSKAHISILEAQDFFGKVISIVAGSQLISNAVPANSVCGAP